MSLATRCTDCGTVFRVVRDQLRVSEGWVRCGRCSAVFNAQERLFDLDEPITLPGELSPTTTPAAPPRHTAAPSRGRGPVGGFDAHGSAVGTPLPAPPPQVFAPPPGFETFIAHEPAPPIARPAEPDHDEPPLPFIRPSDPNPKRLVRHGLPAEPLDEFPPLVPASTPAPLPDPAPAAPGPQAADDHDGIQVEIGREPVADELAVRAVAADAAVTPSFIESADRAAFWRRPAVRGGLTAAGLLCGLLLTLQIGVIWRDLLAARLPALRPALVQVCEWTGCRVGAPRRIDRLTVDASGLTRIEGAPLHRLAVTLRNRADTAVRVPALDLTLIDAQGKLVARRVLQVSDFGSAATAIDVGAELPLQALLSVGDGRISGYTVELFYP